MPHPDTASVRIFDAIGQLNVSQNMPRDQLLAARLTQLYHDGLEEDEVMLPEAVQQCVAFFLSHPDSPRPKMTLWAGSIQVRFNAESATPTVIGFGGTHDGA